MPLAPKLLAMVAKQMNSTPKAVTRGLQSIGFNLERKRLGSGRVTRHYAVLNDQDWHEMLSRYFYCEDGETIPSVPETLKSRRFVSLPREVSQVSQPSQNVKDAQVATDVTLAETGLSEKDAIRDEISCVKVDGFCSLRTDVEKEFSCYFQPRTCPFLSLDGRS